MLLLDPLQFIEQRIEFAIGDFRLGIDVIKPVVAVDLLAQLGGALSGAWHGSPHSGGLAMDSMTCSTHRGASATQLRNCSAFVRCFGTYSRKRSKSKLVAPIPAPSSSASCALQACS